MSAANPRRVQGWLIVYNSDIPQSLTDAQWYCTTRGITPNLMGVAFGTGNEWAIDPAKFSTPPSTGYAVTALTQSGATTSRNATLSSYSVANMVAWFMAQFPVVQGVLVSTYTPPSVTGPSSSYGTVPGLLASYISTSTPHGRLGAPAFNCMGNSLWASEIVPRGKSTLTSGVSSLLYQATTNAMTAEGQDNAKKPHWSTDWLSYSVGFRSEFNAYTLGWLGLQGATAKNLGTDFGGSKLGSYGAASTEILWQSVSQQPDLFALNVGMGFNRSDNTQAPGARVFSNNYTALPGAWSYIWTSDPHWFGEDLLYNGGSACYFTGGEPLQWGILDPMGLYRALMLWRCSLAEALSIRVVDQFAPYAGPFTNLDGSTTFFTGAQGNDKVHYYLRGAPGANQDYYPNLSVMGDPLYRPYKSSYFRDTATAYGLLPGGVIAT